MATATMAHIADQITAALAPTLPYLTTIARDDFGPHVNVRGSFDPQETWVNGIFHNAINVQWYISPAGNDRYTVECLMKDHSLSKFRKYTGTLEQIIEKMLAWVAKNKSV